MYSVFDTYVEEYLQILKGKVVNESQAVSMDEEYEYICVPSNGRNSQRYPCEIKNARKIVRVFPIIE
jgi:hypothetical protein